MRGDRAGVAAAGSAVAVTASGVLPVYLLGVLAVQVRAELGFGTALLGVLVSVFFLCSAAGSSVAGRVVRRAGSAAVMRAAAGVSAACLLAVAALVHGTVLLAVVLVAAGLANGVGQPASNGLIAGLVPVGRQGLAYGAKQAAIPLSTLLGGLSVPLLAVPFGWRWSFAVAGLLGLAAAATVPSAARATARRSPPTPSVAAGPYRTGPLLVVATGFVLAAGAGNAVGAFFVESAVAAGQRPSTAGLLAALGSTAGMLTRVLLGALADRAERRWLVVVALLMAGGTVGYLLLATGQPVLLAVGVVVTYCTGWAWAGLATYAIARMHPGAEARATGVTQGGLGLGSALGPAAFGATAAATSYSTAWLGAAVCSLLAGAAMLAGRQLLLRDRPALVEHHRQRRAGAH